MGGNIFKDEASRIPKDRVAPTFEAYKELLKQTFPMKQGSFDFFEMVGSAGVTDDSGDIDIAIDCSHIIRHFTKDQIEKWGVDYDQWEARYKSISKRSRTATKRMCKMRALLQEISEILSGTLIKVGGNVTAGNIFTCFPQHDESGATNDSVQIDWMVGDIEWLRWSYYSHGEGNLKGLHRTQLLVAAFSEIGYTFNHFCGIKKKKTSEWEITSPEDALGLLSEHYGMVRHSQTQTFAELHSWLLNCDSSLYFKVINRYKDILTSQKQNIPNVLQHTI